MKGYTLILVLFTISYSYGDTCYNSVIANCICYEKTLHIRCEGPISDSKKFKESFTNVSGEFDALYLMNTGLKFIEEETFKESSFKHIFIQQNQNLADIHKNAFTNKDLTETLSIRDNKGLTGTNLFEIAKHFAKTLTTVEFNKNKINILPELIFKGGENVFQQLKNIRLDEQVGGIEEIPSNSFSNLPNLRQLSLDNNGLKKINDNAIDLTKIVSTAHVLIFLSKNKLKAINEKAILFDEKNAKLSVSLMLENNEIEELNDGIIAKILAHGKVHLEGNAGLKCDCKTIPKIKILTNLKSNLGLPPNQQCSKDSAEVDIDQCK